MLSHKIRRFINYSFNRAKRITEARIINSRLQLVDAQPNNMRVRNFVKKFRYEICLVLPNWSRIDARVASKCLVRKSAPLAKQQWSDRLDTVIINEYQATSSIAADINVTQNPESIIDRSSRRFHHCLHFRSVRKGSIPWNIGCVGLALIIPKALLTIAFHSASISSRSFSPSLHLSLSSIIVHDFSLRSVPLFSLCPIQPRSMTMQIASAAYWICPVLDPLLMRGYNSIRVYCNVEYIPRDYPDLAVFRFPVLSEKIYGRAVVLQTRWAFFWKADRTSWAR